MKKTSWRLSALVSALVLTGCGGSSTSDTDILKSTSLAKITGTVPGTLIEAFCDNNYYAQVSSIQNGTNEHPFEIEIPTATNCQLVMTTNENDVNNRVITNIGFSNGRTIVLYNDVDLGHIPLDISYDVTKDSDGDHVVDDILLINENGATSNSDTVQDGDNDGVIDAYEDHDNDGIVNAYEDDDNDGIKNIHDDDDNDNTPDYIEDDDNDGVINYLDDDDNNGSPDYIDDEKYDGTDNQGNTPSTLTTNYVVNEGRLLGAQCAQCHGTNGHSVTNWDSIAGEGEFAHENFSEYPIMQAQANGYTYTEKITIDAWLNTVSENNQDNNYDDDDDYDDDYDDD